MIHNINDIDKKVLKNISSENEPNSSNRYKIMSYNPKQHKVNIRMIYDQNALITNDKKINSSKT